MTHATVQLFLAGGSTRLPSLVDRVARLFPESVTVHSSIDPDEVIAKGCAVQAHLLLGPPETATTAVPSDLAASSRPATLAKPLGFKAADGSLAVVLDEATPLPARRIVEVSTLKGSGKTAVLSLYEGSRSIEVDEVATNGKADSDDEEEEPTKRVALTAERRVAEVGVAVEGKLARVVVVVEADGRGTLTASCGGQEASAAF